MSDVFVSDCIELADLKWYQMQLGDLNFFVMKKDNAYWIATDYQLPEKPALFRPLHQVSLLPDELDVSEKIYLSDSADNPGLVLQLADKPYQVNPAADVLMAPDSKLVLYVSTPLWIQLINSEQQVLAEYPTIKPRLSWVGMNTTQGSLCYSTRSSAPSAIEEVNQYHHRAITALELINDGDRILKVDRLSLPLPMLGLYHSDKRGYWTESVRYRINPENGDTTVVISQKPPEELGEVIKIADPRDREKSGRFRTAMNLIMG